MFYERDFIRFKELTNKLQIFSQKVHNRSERREIFQKYSDNCSLHGFCYIFYRKLHKFERYFWALCVLSAIFATIFTCSILSSKYTNRSIMTVIQNSEYPVSKIPFPAIAICSNNRVNLERINLAQKKFLPTDANNATIDVFTNFVKRLNRFQFKNFDNWKGLENKPLHLIDAISVTEVASFLAIRCDELFYENCKFDEQNFDCCKGFISENTELGKCLVFNSIASDESREKTLSDKYYPFHISKNGEGSGLIFSFKRNKNNILPSKHSLAGVELMIKKPDQWTDWRSYQLRPNTQNEIILHPVLTEASENLKNFQPSFRKCLYEHEKSTRFFIPNLNYNQWNCRSQCHQYYLIQYCNCTIPLFFSVKDIQAAECKPSDYICIYKNRDIFSRGKLPDVEKFIRQKRPGRGMDCPCPVSCRSLTYPVTINTVPIFNITDNVITTRVDIYYQSEVILNYLTTLKYSIWDLVGYFGGIVTLFVGASILSGVEFIHFLMVESTSYFKERKLNNKKSKKLRPRAI